MCNVLPDGVHVCACVVTAAAAAADVSAAAATAFETIAEECKRLSNADAKATCLRAWEATKKARMTHDIARAHLADRSGLIALKEAKLAARVAAARTAPGRHPLSALRDQESELKKEKEDFRADVDALNKEVDAVVTPVEEAVFEVAATLGCVGELNLGAASAARDKRVAEEVKKIAVSVIEYYDAMAKLGDRGLVIDCAARLRALADEVARGARAAAAVAVC